jgi:phosphate-selective porin OprO/OprP
MLCAAQVCGQQLPTFPATENTGDQASLELRLDELAERHARLEAQYSEVAILNQELHAKLAELTELVSSQDASRDSLNSSSQLFQQPEDIRTDQPEMLHSSSNSSSYFDDGFRWASRDNEFSLAFHNETQLDVRGYEQAHSDPVNQFGMYISRMRLYFTGTLTEPIEYSVSVNKGLGNLDLLDAYFNFNYDPRLQFRIGRFRVPFTYDWYALSNQYLTTPERSVFAINYGYNRNWALMLHGEREDERGEYAIAMANGPRNQYFDFNADKDVLTYVNFRPFQDADVFPVLENWNFGGSMGYGLQDQAARPRQFRTSLNATESAGAIEAAPAFLTLDDDVREHGPRHLWDVHTALYYRQLTLMAAWDTGYNSYSLDDDPIVRVPTHGWHAQFGYFLTGEEITRRTMLEPLHPFDLRPGKRGWGAFELQARYDDFKVGDEIFTAGLADSNLGTNHVQTIDSGLNWYLNKFTKVYFDWQHSSYAQPVPYRPGSSHDSSDLFWVRFQIYM